MSGDSGESGNSGKSSVDYDTSMAVWYGGSADNEDSAESGYQLLLTIAR